jgi:hypothetical protein
VLGEAGDEAAADQRLELGLEGVGLGLGVDLVAVDVERERLLVLLPLRRVLDRRLGPLV